jgi:hypothetical protein
MSVILTRLTELDAVNSMLATIAESPVSTLETGSHEDAIIARQVLKQVSGEVQDEGWYFNTEYGYTLPPDSEGYIRPPEGVLSIDVEPMSRGYVYDILVRGDRLYNNTLHTYTFDSPLYVTVKWALSWEYLPETAKRYIIARASRVFQAKAMGSETLNRFTLADEARTRAALLREDVNNVDGNYGGIPHKKAWRGYDTINKILQRDI